jgi:hypothetical protein
MDSDTLSYTGIITKDVLEQKSRDFKEYLKVQLQEVHETSVKEK